jgi:hypothetical protein
MKKPALFLCLSVLVPALLWGQEAENKSHGHGYVFFAPGAATTFGCRSCTSGTLHFGGGGEGTFYRGLGIGGEIGYIGAMGSLDGGLGLGSINGVYIFRSHGKSKLEPFITGGFSVAIANGILGAANFGGGIQYWRRKRVGLRLEFRDHFPTQSFSDHLFEGRVGFAFR